MTPTKRQTETEDKKPESRHEIYLHNINSSTLKIESYPGVPVPVFEFNHPGKNMIKYQLNGIVCWWVK